jgi:hypothetical protein
MHYAGPGTPGRASPLTFDQQKQQTLEYLKFPGGALGEEISVGNGKLFWEAYPVELAEANAATQTYEQILKRLGLSSPYSFPDKLPDGILIYPTDLEDAVLYILESESDRDCDITLHDALTGTDLKLQLPAQHAALALIDKQTRQLVAKYGF